MSRRRQKRQSGWELVFLFIMLVLALAYVLYSRQEQAAPSPAAGGGLEVHFIDVGQADAALVICDWSTPIWRSTAPSIWTVW